MNGPKQRWRPRLVDDSGAAGSDPTESADSHGGGENLDPKLMMALTSRAKRQLRARMKALRSAHPAESLAARSAAIVKRLIALDDFVKARSIALFWPLLEQHEVDLRELDAAARAAGKRVYYPFMDEQATAEHGESERSRIQQETLRTGFRPADAPEELANRGRRFFEPDPRKRPAERGDVEVIFVPALAVSESGYRLGMGAGFYDATLPEFCPPALAVAVAYDFQFLAEIPRESHDVPCELVVTDRRIISSAEGPLSQT